MARQPRECGERAQILAERAGWRAPDGFAGAHDFRSKDARARTHNCACFDARFVAYTHLAADDGVIADYDPARKPGLRGDDYVIADLAIVADVHLVIEFDAVADAGDSQSCAVNAGIRANFDVVSDFDRAHLRKLAVMPVFVERETEAIGTDDRACVHDGIAANVDAVVYGDVCMERGTGADGDAASY